MSRVRPDSLGDISDHLVVTATMQQLNWNILPDILLTVPQHSALVLPTVPAHQRRPPVDLDQVGPGDGLGEVETLSPGESVHVQDLNRLENTELI